MRDRPETPDIMNDLMCSTGVSKSDQELKLETAFDNKTIQPPSNRSDLKQLLDASSLLPSFILKDPKEKTTFNLSEKILRGLEDCWIEARRLTGDKQISKTLIVEKALEIALADFTDKRQMSVFYRKLVSNKKKVK